MEGRQQLQTRMVFAIVTASNSNHSNNSYYGCRTFTGALPWTKHFFIFFYFLLRWVFIAARRLSLVVVSRGYSLLWCAGCSLRWLLLLRRVGFNSCGTRAQ